MHDPVDAVEHATSKGATAVLMPMSAHRASANLSGETAAPRARAQEPSYADAGDALRKALREG